MKMKKMVVFLAIMLLAAFAAGCGGSSDKLAAIKEKGKITLGTSADFPPFEFHLPVNGKDEVVGLDIAIAKEVAKELGVELEIKDMDFDSVLLALASGKVDFAMSGLSVTDERKQSVDFTKDYYQSEQAIIVRASDKDNFKTLADFKGKTIGAQLGSVQEEVAHTQLADAKTDTLPKIPDLILKLKSGKADGVVLDLPVAEAFVSKNSDLVIADAKPDNQGGFAAAVKKGDAKLLTAIDNVLDKLAKENKLDEFKKEAAEQMLQQ